MDCPGYVLCKPADDGDTDNDCDILTSLESNEIQWMTFFSLPDPSSNVTFTYTNDNQPMISAANSAQNSVQNENNDQDTNESNANNNLDNAGTNVTINNNSGRRKRSLRKIVQDFKERQMSSIFERLIGHFHGKKEEREVITK